MAAASSVCRKRPRSTLEEDCDDCLPISKRINKLHIESSRLSQECGAGVTSSEQQLNQPQPGQGCPAGPACPSAAVSSPPVNMDSANNNELLQGTLNVVQTSHGSCSMEDIQGYDPELKEQENPHYFQANSVLYEAHLMRVTRTKSFHMLDS